MSGVKPCLLESNGFKRYHRNVSPGFMRIFAEDSADQKMRIPIAGYQGHRAGVSS